MTKIIYFALLIAGIVLTVYGIREMNSLSSELSRVFTNTPSDRSLFMMIGGIMMSIIGAGGMFGLLRDLKN